MAFSGLMPGSSFCVSTASRDTADRVVRPMDTTTASTLSSAAVAAAGTAGAASAAKAAGAARRAADASSSPRIFIARIIGPHENDIPAA